MSRERYTTSGDTKEFIPPEITRFGNYFLVRKLAEGGMAEIFLAKQIGAEGFERNVVIKRMLSHLSAIDDFVNMFLDEARLAARLAHHNIVQINDLGLADGCYYICMEYLPGEDFSTVLRTSSRRGQYLPLSMVARVIAEAGRGLHYAHEFADETGRPLNIVHRDISPSNIYVTYQGQVKLLDFGIAKAESRVTHTTAGVVKGKYMYMSPEQARGDPVDRRADVYSLGVSLYEALTHIRPFAKDNELAILNSVLKNQYIVPRAHRPELPQALEDIVIKAISADVADRYPTTADMAKALEAFIASAPDGDSAEQFPALLGTLFGEVRVANKTRVPTLASYVKLGVKVQGWTPPPGGVPTTVAGKRSESSPRNPIANPPGDATVTLLKDAIRRPTERISVVPPPDEKGPWKKWRWVPVVALAALVGLGSWWWMSSPRQTPEVREPPPVPNPEPIVDAGPSVTPDASVAVAPTRPPDATPAEPEPSNTNTKRIKKGPVFLEAADVERIVGRQRASIMSCFETHKASLPNSAGSTQVRFSILAEGRVKDASVTGDLEGTDVAKCLERRFVALKFPAHRDRLLTLTLPLQYQVSK